MPLVVHLVLGTVVDDVLVHADGRWVQGGLSTPQLAHHQLHFGDGHHPHVQLLHHAVVLLHTGMRHGGRHQQEAALVQRGHELPADPGEDRGQTPPWRRVRDVPADRSCACLDRREQLVRPLPDEQPEQNDRRGDGKEQRLVPQAPAQDHGVEALQRPQEEQDRSDREADEHHVQHQ